MEVYNSNHVRFGLRGDHMTSRYAIIAADTVLKGTISNGGQVEVYGYFEGEIAAETLVVHEGGRVFGRARVDSAYISGTLQGEAFVRNLISLTRSGVVSGNVRYSKIAMEAGAELTAELRNVPPEMAGDMQILVSRGRWVVLTTSDVTALDPDSNPNQLVYSISNVTCGKLVHLTAPTTAIDKFTQVDVVAGLIAYQHDGSVGDEASFDLVVTDQAGATSGTPKRMRIAIRAA
jgi:cytoskeletal protein CcmA (bactofilin family)